MKIIAMEVGYIATNCYIVVNEETHHGVIIDPGGDAGRIMEAVQKENLTVDAIFLTHGHGDHIMALAEVAEKTGAPVYISKEDAPMLTDPVGSLAAYIGKPFQFGDYLIVVGIAVLSAVLLPYFLQGVDDNKPGVRVFPDKAL